MKEIILNFPKQFKVGFRAAQNINIKPKLKKVCICGMGGSALPANLLAMVLEEYKEKLSLTIQRDYTLPSSVDRQTLIVCISYSGNTEETISCTKEALKRKLKIVLISSDGQLEKLAKRYSLPFVRIEKGYPPRMALGYLFGALIGILNTLKFIPASLKKELIELEGTLKPEQLEKEGKSLATKLKGRVPVIYASNRLKYLARIWKIKFNENTKIPAFWNYFP
ncbi:SIS domain-containing protein, partial [bacterium]|nr:SIS domain-containing protein [bacterium]